MVKKSEKGTVLLVDDEAIIRDSLRQWLEMEDFQVFTAANGEEALQICKTADLDIGVFDIRMPGMDGITLLSHVKNYCPDMAVIMMTAFASIEDAVRCISQGAYDYIIKPFPPEKLTQTIHHIMETRLLRHERQRTISKKQLLSLYLNSMQSFLSLGVATAILTGPEWVHAQILHEIKEQSDDDAGNLIQRALVNSRELFTPQSCSLAQLVDVAIAILEIQSDLPLTLVSQIQDESMNLRFPLVPAAMALQTIGQYLLHFQELKNHLLFKEQYKPDSKKMLQIITMNTVPEQAQHELTALTSGDGLSAPLAWAGTILKTMDIHVTIAHTPQGSEINVAFPG